MLAGDDIRSPRLLPSPEVSFALIYNGEEAHREFLRIADVTESISEYRTCFMEAFCLLLEKVFEEVIKMDNVSNTSTNTSTFPF